MRRLALLLALVVVLVFSRIVGGPSQAMNSVGSQKLHSGVQVYLAQSTHAELYLALRRAGTQLMGRLTVAYLAGQDGNPLVLVPADAHAHYRLHVLQPVFVTGSISKDSVDFRPVDLLGKELPLISSHGLGDFVMTVLISKFNLGRLRLMPVAPLSLPTSLRALERIAADLNSPNYPAFS